MKFLSPSCPTCNYGPNSKNWLISLGFPLETLLTVWQWVNRLRLQAWPNALGREPRTRRQLARMPPPQSEVAIDLHAALKVPCLAAAGSTPFGQAVDGEMSHES